MREPEYTDAAQDDLTGQYAAIFAQKGEAAASAFLSRMVDRCEDLARFPEMGRRRPELDGFGLTVRSIREDGRLIVYARRGDGIVVARVLREGEFAAW